MKEGHVFFALGFEGDWPPHERNVMATSPQGQSRVTLFALPNGAMEFVVEESNSIVIRHRTQPIRFEGSGMFVFDAGWKDARADIRLNGQLVPSIIEMARPLVVQLQKSEIPEGISLDDPNAVSACQKWIEWRKDRYSKPKSFDIEYLRPKSFEEQASELQNAIAGLTHHVEEFINDKKFLIVDIATVLRALVYWEDGKASKYNPLLLRIAGRLDPALPLPVYAFAEPVEETPDIVHEAESHIINSWISLRHEFPMQKLTDLQDVLDSAILIERIDSTSASAKGGKMRKLRGRDLIREFASTSATGHYHEHVRREFDRINTTNAFDLPLSYRFMLRIGSVVADLGKFVIHNLPPLSAK